MQRAARKPHLSEITAGGSIIENISQTKRLAETKLDGNGCTKNNEAKVLPDVEQPTNTASGSNEDDDEPDHAM
jgi:dopamine D2-like receptor